MSSRRKGARDVGSTDASSGEHVTSLPSSLREGGHGAELRPVVEEHEPRGLAHRAQHRRRVVSNEALLRQYDAASPRLRARGEELSSELAELLSADSSLKVHSVAWRLKSRESVARKLARPDRDYTDLWMITDLVGLRVITYFEDAVDRVGEVIEARLSVDFAQSADKRRRQATEFGYRSLHYICAAGASLPSPARFEIQVRTVLEHAWAEIEHDLGYKATEAVPSALRRRFNRLAGLLELADQEFGAIRRDLEGYAQELPAKIEAGGAPVPLDRFSLVALLDCAEVRTLDDAISALLGKELGEDPFYPDYLLKILTASGLRSVADVRKGVAEHDRAIAAMVQPSGGSPTSSVKRAAKPERERPTRAASSATVHECPICACMSDSASWMGGSESATSPCCRRAWQGGCLVRIRIAWTTRTSASRCSRSTLGGPGLSSSARTSAIVLAASGSDVDASLENATTSGGRPSSGGGARSSSKNAATIEVRAPWPPIRRGPELGPPRAPSHTSDGTLVFESRSTCAAPRGRNATCPASSKVGSCLSSSRRARPRTTRQSIARLRAFMSRPHGARASICL